MKKRIKFFEKINILGFLRQMDIRRRMIFSFMLLSLLPIIIISIFSYISIYNNAEDKNYEYVRNISSQVFNNINYTFEKYVNKFERVTHNSTILADIYNYTEYDIYRNDEVRNRVQLALESIIGKSEGIDSVQIITRRGDIFSYNSGVTGIGVTYDNKLLNSVNLENIAWKISGKDYYKEGVYSQEPHILMVRKIKYGYDNNSTGFAIMTIDKKYIDNQCKKNVLKDDSYHYVVITTNDNIIISHPDENMVFKPYDNKMQASKTGANSNMIQKIKTNGKDLLVCSEKIYANNWNVINVFNNSQLLASTTHNVKIMLLLAFICILFSLLFLSTVSRSISLPVLNLISKIEKVGSGDFNVKIEDSGENIKDEHALLANGFNDMTMKLKTLIDDYYNAQINEKRLEFLKKEAELNALQQQINPHFLNNVLETIFWTAQMKDFEDIGEMISALGNFLRVSINNNIDCIRIIDEIKNVENYIYLQKIRFKDKFNIKWEIDDNVKDYKVIKLILQPFIENSIIHGIREKSGEGLIVVRCYKLQKNVIFEIIDNGRGISSENVIRLQKNIDNPEKGSYKNVGIKNVNQRIKLYFGAQYGVKIKSEINRGTIVKITLPAILGEFKIITKREVEDANVQNDDC